jgi:hypothetical protein
VGTPWSLLWPVLADAGSLRFIWRRPWQLFGLTLAIEERDDLTASCGLFGPGPEPICRAHPVDSTTADKIQGLGLRLPGPSDVSPTSYEMLVVITFIIVVVFARNARRQNQGDDRNPAHT